MSLINIQTALLARLEAQGGLPPIYFPNSSEALPTTNYISPMVLPANTQSLGLSTTDRENGIFQILIYVKKGTSELEASRIALQILDTFPRNLTLTGVRINVAGSIGPTMFDGSWAITPVTIPYQNIT